MKRELLQNIKVQPYTSGSTIVRTGFLSAILAIKVGTAGDLKITVTHGDTDAAADVVTDELIFPEAQTEGGVFEVKNVQASDIVNIDVDLLGLKDYVKFTVSGSAATNTAFAIALGDKFDQPV